MKKIILDLCGGTGSWSAPYKEAGYEILNITLPDYDVFAVDFFDEDMEFRSRTGKESLYARHEDIVGIFAAPPCTEFSIARNHKLARDTEGGMEIVNACLDIIKKCNPVFYAIENPIGVLSKFLGKPQYTFQPYEFGDAWTKRTMLWGNFNFPIKRFKKYTDIPPIEGLYVRPGRKTASIAFNHLGHKRFIRAFDNFTATDDASFRAITPKGFAEAFYKANP